MIKLKPVEQNPHNNSFKCQMQAKFVAEIIDVNFYFIEQQLWLFSK